MRKVLLLLDFARSRSAVLSVGEPALGALLAYGGIPPIRTVLLGLLAATAGYLCVYALNDLLDLKADRQEIEVASAQPEDWDPTVPHLDILALRHPVAAGALPLWAGITWVTVLGIIGLVAAYILRPICAWLFIVCALLQVLYCCLRRRTWLKLIPGGVMVAVGGLAGWFAVGEAGWGALAFFLLLFVWEVAGRNLTNDLADVRSDRMIGIATLAATHGPAVAVRGIVAGAVAMPLLGLAQTGPWQTRIMVAVVALLTMTAPVTLFFRQEPDHAAQRYFNVTSWFPAVAAACLIVYDLVLRLT